MSALPIIDSVQIGMHWFAEQPGGLERMYLALSDGLPGAGVRVRGLLAGGERAALDTHGAIRAFARADAPLLTRLWGARQALKAMIAARRPDIVASHFPLYGLPTRGVATDSARVTHFHGPWADEARAEGGQCTVNRLKHALETFAYGRQQRYIVLSRAFADVLARRYRVPPERIRVVPGCVDVSTFAVPASRAQARARLALPTDRPILVTVRRLTRRMGLENLIDAMPALLSAVPDALLVVVGRGPLAEALAARIAERGLERHVHLLGRVGDGMLPLVYRAADLSIVPSLSLEGFGLTTVESLAAGTPVMVTPVGGLPEAVCGLDRNLVLAGTSPAALADGLRGALRGGTALPSEARCRRYARENFDMPLMARRVAAVYREALRG